MFLSLSNDSINLHTPQSAVFAIRIFNSKDELITEITDKLCIKGYNKIKLNNLALDAGVHTIELKSSNASYKHTLSM